HRPVNVPVVNLHADALAAELAGDLLGHGDAPVPATPAGDVNTGEDWLYLHGVDRVQRPDAVDVEGDNAVRSRRRQDVVADHRIQPGAVAHLRVMVRIPQCVAQVDQQRIPISGRWSVQHAVGGDDDPDQGHWVLLLCNVKSRWLQAEADGETQR